VTGPHPGRQGFSSAATALLESVPKAGQAPSRRCRGCYAQSSQGRVRLLARLEGRGPRIQPRLSPPGQEPPPASRLSPAKSSVPPEPALGVSVPKGGPVRPEAPRSCSMRVNQRVVALLWTGGLTGKDLVTAGRLATHQMAQAGTSPTGLPTAGREASQTHQTILPAVGPPAGHRAWTSLDQRGQRPGQEFACWPASPGGAASITPGNFRAEEGPATSKCSCGEAEDIPCRSDHQSPHRRATTLGAERKSAAAA